MKQTKQYSKKDYHQLLDFILSQLRSHGMKATTMDSLSNSLHISKRTLYEIFGSKENMFIQTNEYFMKRTGIALKEIFDSSQNIMEAILKSFLYHRDIMIDVNIEFLRDINEYFSAYLQKKDFCIEKVREQHYLNLYDVLMRGVDEGYFRDDLNIKVQCRMFLIQMESLKRMEELFPKDITLLEAFDAINIGFLRAICTEKGLKELECFLPLIQTKD